ncbi:MAG: hypothetical protein KF850_12075 [Labilithrix sp.]|nr:hypothetical protein [Labilithrix sp.]MBX3212765.1 hypothetical protein [Labilithrix sp.]
MDVLGVAGAWAAVARTFEGARHAVPAVVQAHGSDALFAASVALFLVALWGHERRVLGLGLAFVLTLELLQAAGVAPGTFDVLDLAAEAAAYVLAAGAAYASRSGRAAAREVT